MKLRVIKQTLGRMKLLREGLWNYWYVTYEYRATGVACSSTKILWSEEAKERIGYDVMGQADEACWGQT